MVNEIAPLELIRKIVSGEIEVGKAKQVENLISIIQEEIKSLCFPADKVYISFSSKSPAQTIGGSWTHLNSVFLYSASSETVSAGGTGGSSTHELATAEMPNHRHEVYMLKKTTSTSYPTGKPTNVETTSGRYIYSTTNGYDGLTSYTGEGKAFSILPPYITVHMWRKTAA